MARIKLRDIAGAEKVSRKAMLGIKGGWVYAQVSPSTTLNQSCLSGSSSTYWTNPWAVTINNNH